ncbi:4-carboxymuconolactone decarboxylase [Lysobacter sp. yr284]|uniref:carboxymuconolactone decarboxylase family protein n=1 Tax=Lysobacter TaxID=68 RepID=UPI000896C19E|nr:carboxymuconolactone decarboxylase family protein [Lysobacter sp. yr284]SDY57306.1 4-carboxymuconolactone decarboxylase [Lysobacter sp. yr284]
MSQQDRYEKGLAKFREVFGRDPLPGQNEDFIRITLEHLFGDIWTRPHLSVHERELITLSALAMLRAERELKGHLGAAVQLGIERGKIVETMIHLAHYGGWPVANTGLRIAQEVFAEADAKAAQGG